MPSRGEHVLIAGVATRALARSAVRAGHTVTALDAFGDVDLREVAEVVALTRSMGGFLPEKAAALSRRIPARVVAYTSNFENYPDAVARLAAGRRLLGNPPDVLRAVRDPFALMRALASRGFLTPITRASAPGDTAGQVAWLLKPRRSGGGHATAVWSPGRPVSRRNYLQQRLPGNPGSIIFLADGVRVFPLGVTRQLVGDRGFGASGFRYCGSLLSSVRAPLFKDEGRVREVALALAAAVTEEFGLVGLNGLDFIARDGMVWPIEVNPRATSSMELVERAGGPPLFELHARACRGRLPDASSRPAEPRRVSGKGVLFARRDVVIGDFIRRLGDAADRPHPGERIGRGHPICTVFALGSDRAACLRALAARARRVYTTLEAGLTGAGAA